MSKNAALDFSVVICTYNGALRLPGLLERLQNSESVAWLAGAAEAVPFRWEVVIVDNNSSDRTAEVVRKAQKTWPADIPLRYCLEREQGLAFARRRAIKEIHSPLIGFLDDDILPDATWVSAAFAFGQQHPEVGAYGSSIQGLYETTPPPGFHRIACCLAIIDRGQEPFQYAVRSGVLPSGAGMVIRRRAWIEQVPERPALAGVKAGSLKAKGEDVETLSYIRQAWPIWHNPAMKLSHIISSDRLQRDYLLNLVWQIGLSRYPLRKVNYAPWQWPLMVPLYFASDIRKELVYLFKRWIQQALSGQPFRAFDTVEACELALLTGSLLSPFYASARWGKHRLRATYLSTGPHAC